jgi:predicted DNA-binding antitoxin AbrB/MazE fold protein
MALQVEAIFENGVLRPLAPLGLKDRQHVTITVDEVASGQEQPVAFNPRYAEMRWIRENAGRYIGEWLALDGEQLISHGASLHEVDAEASGRSVEEPLFYHVPLDWGQPSAGGLWL